MSLDVPVAPAELKGHNTSADAYKSHMVYSKGGLYWCDGCAPNCQWDIPHDDEMKVLSARVMGILDLSAFSTPSSFTKRELSQPQPRPPFLTCRRFQIGELHMMKFLAASFRPAWNHLPVALRLLFNLHEVFILPLSLG